MRNNPVVPNAWLPSSVAFRGMILSHFFRGSKKGIRKKESKTEKERGSRERRGARQSRKEEMGGTKGKIRR